ncbi:unnamed protein product, partial [marine sediment metagenome]
MWPGVEHTVVPGEVLLHVGSALAVGAMAIANAAAAAPASGIANFSFDR